MSETTKEALLRRHAERLAQSMVEERHEVSRALFDLLNEARKLRDDSAWLMETWLYEYTNLDQGEQHIVDHSCDFALRPDIGACDFHEKWFGIAERNGMMDQFAEQNMERQELDAQ
jgi:hypothetical protein